MIASRDLFELHPSVRRMAEEHVDACREQGLDLLIYCTYRDAEQQDALYALGRTVPGRIVTNARGGESMHNYRLAYDAVPLIGGKAQWNDDALIRRVGQLGEEAGLEWAGRWTGKLRESVHFQWTDGLTLGDLQRGVMPA